jgi:hypothetical protein
VVISCAISRGYASSEVLQPVLGNILQGVPTIRSKESAHGEGAVPRDVPSYLAEYALNATAAAILFFVRAHLSKK